MSEASSSLLRLREAMEKKLMAAQELLDMAEGIREAAEEEDIVQVDRLLERRQALIQRVEKIDAEIVEIGRGSIHQGGNTHLRFHDRIEPLWEAIVDIFRRAAEADRSAIAAITSRQKGIKDELLRMRSGCKSIRAYWDGSAAGPRFMDVRR